MKIEGKDGAEILVRHEAGTTVISANREGLLSLSGILAALAHEPEGSHVHLDAYNALEDGSSGLILEKTAAETDRGS